MVLMIAIGIYASRKTHSTVEFIVAGRRLPLWLCTTSIIATWFGGGMLIGGAGASYEKGMLGVIVDPFGGALCLLLVGLFFVRLFRRLKLLTFVEFVEQRFGLFPSIITSLGSLVSSLLWTASMLVAFGLIFETLTGIPLEYGIIGGALVVVIYTTIGGMMAVALTDFAQIVVIAIGLIILLVVVLIDSGGWATVSPQLAEHTFRMYPLEHTAENWGNYLRMWVIFGLADIGSQSLLGRAMAAKSEDVAQRSFFLASAGYLAFGMVPVILGIIASVTMPGLTNPESVIPTLAIEHLHPFAIAIFVGALLAAIMSSADSTLLATASIVSTNLLPLVHKDPSERLRLIVARAAIPFGGAIALYGALNAQEVFNTMIDANMLQLAAVIGPLILGVWWKKANRFGAIAGMSMGVVAWLSTTYVFNSNLPGDLIGLAASLAAMIFVALLTQNIDPPRDVRDSDGNVVELTNRV